MTRFDILAKEELKFFISWEVDHLPTGSCTDYKKEYLLTYSMEQSPSWEANRFSDSQEIPHILWNPKIH